MKKIFICLTVLMSAAFFTASAQYCGAPEVTIGNCGIPAGYGFENLDSIPCIVQGQPTSIVLPFRDYQNFTAQGNTVTIHWLQIDTLSNLPCGLCWSTNKPTNEFRGGEFGCFKIQGLTHDPVGQYKINLVLNVNTTNSDSTHFDVTSINADLGGIYLYVRVVAPGGGNCPAVDTSAHGQRLTASCDTFNTAIRLVTNSLRDLTIQPNPVSTEAKVSFTSDFGGEQLLRISNVIGKEVFSTMLNTKPGLNETSISKGSLPAGLYILTIGSKQGMATKKFIVAE